MTLATAAFKTEFAVDMTCQNCVDAVANALRDLPGIERYDIELEQKRVTITGKTPPSQLLSALKASSRQVLVRGSSSADLTLPSQAAISILESPVPVPTIATTSTIALAGQRLPGMNEEEFSQKVFGICRFVQIAPRSILLDLTVRIPPPPVHNVGLGVAHRSAYRVYISTTGNIVNPPVSTGKAFLDLGRITPDADGYGDLFKEIDGELWEWIGRACVVEAEITPSTPEVASEGTGASLGNIFAGVVARSAGAWGNDKTVCACSGRTMWEEGREMEQRSLV